MKKIVGLIAILLSIVANTYAQREDILLNDNWEFRFSYQVQPRTAQRVDLPHTWNAQDALSGKPNYQRSIGNYEKMLFVRPEWKGKRLFLKFEGANTIANVFINRQHLGEHRGGYGAFIFEITDQVKYGENNRIGVRVSNAEQLEVMPLVGDFNFYGGIYRPVHLLITDETCISPLDYASSGVYLSQTAVNEQQAQVQAKILLSNTSKSVQPTVKIAIKDKSQVIFSDTKKLTTSDTVALFDVTIPHPHLWNGTADPFLYTAEISLWNNDKLIDQVTQPLGLRYYRVDPDKGFFLNGKYLELQGVCRHQDRAEIGNALHDEHHVEDVQLMLEMGVNAIRLAHYPQATTIYDLMDKYGIVTWAEIPFIGPGGYLDKGFVNQLSFRENGKEQLKELIRQHYNHPSICFWGLFNELKEQGDNPIEYIQELNDLAHQEDTTRLTTSASNQSGDMNYITDLIAWNRYDGWYGASPSSLARFLDKTHNDRPNLRIGISEYGAGASIYHQQDSLKQPDAPGRWHPENWQTYFHIENWKIIRERPFVWGSFIWNMFDFGAAHRTEGDRMGINDKGLVTFDRKVKKDSYYFYKANWNKKEPMIYLAEKRNTNRTNVLQNFTVFTTEKEAELFINGKSIGKKSADDYAIIRWENVILQSGENTIEVVTTGKTKLKDEVIIRLF
jgi:beta-galactosidase